MAKEWRHALLGNSISISLKSAKYLDQETNHQTIMLGSCMVKLLQQLSDGPQNTAKELWDPKQHY